MVGVVNGSCVPHGLVLTPATIELTTSMKRATTLRSSVVRMHLEKSCVLTLFYSQTTLFGSQGDIGIFVSYQMGS